MIQIFCDQCKREIEEDYLKIHIEIKPKSRDYRIPIPDWEIKADRKGDFCSVQCAIQWLGDSPWRLSGLA